MGVQIERLLDQIESVRAFSRFYTRKIGVLQEGLLGSPFSLSEGRVLYEIAHHEQTTAAELSRELGLDAGYLSRILKGLAGKGLLTRRTAAHDARQSEVSLTEAGQAAFAAINTRSRAEIGEMLRRLTPDDRVRLVDALTTARELLGDSPSRRVPYILRPPQPGDIGWVVHRHGVLYALEYGWDETFEAMVAEIAARFIRELDPERERCWIAERDGENVGAAFLVADSPEVAKIRLVIVEPSARGLGIGTRLVDECIRFARLKRYRTLTLWTNDVLAAARRIYERAGFELASREPHHSFGQDLVGEYWSMEL